MAEANARRIFWCLGADDSFGQIHRQKILCVELKGELFFGSSEQVLQEVSRPGLLLAFGLIHLDHFVTRPCGTRIDAPRSHEMLSATTLTDTAYTRKQLAFHFHAVSHGMPASGNV